MSETVDSEIFRPEYLVATLSRSRGETTEPGRHKIIRTETSNTPEEADVEIHPGELRRRDEHRLLLESTRPLQGFG